jgi:hypothetical protein
MFVMDAPKGSLRAATSRTPDGMAGRREREQICVHHGGRALLTTCEQANVFLRRVQALVNYGRSELVPLLHADGVDLLFVAANTPLLIHDVRDHSCDGGHAG